MRAVSGRAMRVLGMMSGTSADGIDVALARISGAPPAIAAKFERHHHVRFPVPVREAILRLANGATTTTAEISQLNFLLGEEFARAAIAACKKWRVALRQISLIGSHGQTIFHQGVPAGFLGRRVASTLQIGEPSIIAERTGVTTIADFRPADMAAGGQGAPLVPFVDYLLYRDARIGRVALNVGGIANLTLIPAGARPGQLFAFDIGPGNMVIDAIVEIATRGRSHYDRDARLAIRGKLIPALLSKMLRRNRTCASDRPRRRDVSNLAAPMRRRFWDGSSGIARRRKIWSEPLQCSLPFRLRMRCADLFCRVRGWMNLSWPEAVRGIRC